MRTFAVVILASCLQARGAPADDLIAKEAYLSGSEIYVTLAGSGEERQLTSDGVRKWQVTLSNDGRHIAYTVDTQLRELDEIVVIRADGSLERRIHFRPEEANISGMRGVEGLRWLSSRRLVAYGGINPSTVEYAVIDITTGKEVGGYLVDGFAFVPSPDGSHIAFEGYIPHFSAEEEHRPRLCLDQECGLFDPDSGYPPWGNRHIEFTSLPVWSPDGAKVAIPAQDYTTKAESVIVRIPGGKTTELKPPPEAVAGLEPGPQHLNFSWDGNNIAIRTPNPLFSQSGSA